MVRTFQIMHGHVIDKLDKKISTRCNPQKGHKKEVLCFQGTRPLELEDCVKLNNNPKAFTTAYRKAKYLV